MKLNLKKILPFIAAFLAVVLFASGAFVGGYWYGGKLVKLEPQATPESCGDCIKPLPAPDTSSWKTYRNEELGFEIRYPDEYSVIKVFDATRQVGEYFSEYTRKCESGEIQGCGGGPLPKYMFKFQTYYQENVKSVDKNPFNEPDEFSIRIYDTKFGLDVNEGPTGISGIRWYMGKTYQMGLAEKSYLVYDVEAEDGMIYVISFSTDYIPDKYTNLTGAIVSTFRFLE